MRHPPHDVTGAIMLERAELKMKCMGSLMTRPEYTGAWEGKCAWANKRSSDRRKRTTRRLLSHATCCMISTYAKCQGAGVEKLGKAWLLEVAFRNETRRWATINRNKGMPWEYVWIRHGSKTFAQMLSYFRYPRRSNDQNRSICFHQPPHGCPKSV